MPLGDLNPNLIPLQPRRQRKPLPFPLVPTPMPATASAHANSNSNSNTFHNHAPSSIPFLLLPAPPTVNMNKGENQNPNLIPLNNPRQRRRCGALPFPLVPTPPIRVPALCADAAIDVDVPIEVDVPSISDALMDIDINTSAYLRPHFYGGTAVPLDSPPHYTAPVYDYASSPAYVGLQGVVGVSDIDVAPDVEMEVEVLEIGIPMDVDTDVSYLGSDIKMSSPIIPYVDDDAMMASPILGVVVRPSNLERAGVTYRGSPSIRVTPKEKEAVPRPLALVVAAHVTPIEDEAEPIPVEAPALIVPLDNKAKTNVSTDIQPLPIVCQHVLPILGLRPHEAETGRTGTRQPVDPDDLAALFDGLAIAAMEPVSVMEPLPSIENILHGLPKPPVKIRRKRGVVHQPALSSPHRNWNVPSLLDPESSCSTSISTSTTMSTSTPLVPISIDTPTHIATTVNTKTTTTTSLTASSPAPISASASTSTAMFTSISASRSPLSPTIDATINITTTTTTTTNITISSATRTTSPSIPAPAHPLSADEKFDAIVTSIKEDYANDYIWEASSRPIPGTAEDAFVVEQSGDGGSSPDSLVSLVTVDTDVTMVEPEPEVYDADGRLVLYDQSEWGECVKVGSDATLYGSWGGGLFRPLEVFDAATQGEWGGAVLRVGCATTGEREGVILKERRCGERERERREDVKGVWGVWNENWEDLRGEEREVYKRERKERRRAEKERREERRRERRREKEEKEKEREKDMKTMVGGWVDHLEEDGKEWEEERKTVFERVKGWMCRRLGVERCRRGGEVEVRIFLQDTPGYFVSQPSIGPRCVSKRHLASIIYAYFGHRHDYLAGLLWISVRWMFDYVHGTSFYRVLALTWVFDSYLTDFAIAFRNSRTSDYTAPLLRL
ncbi:hypothetical protein Hypma_002337 [Hypsizygus marmoreus]|uniref:Uncharacterized protein n=1 Tax=Hypsizygus marmoreus TaxID=39966 RepID=A0A369J987_HYPMA|nr:hypothetical protein Hypma_002337 [Hypsizygus marmoreus]